MTTDRLDFLRRNLAAPPFHRWLEPEVASVSEDGREVAIRLALRPDFRRAEEGDVVHGGIVAALIDIAGHAAVAAAVGHGVPTVDLRIDYLRMASGAELLARARAVKVGRTLAVVDVTVLDEHERTVALGRGAFSTREG